MCTFFRRKKARPVVRAASVHWRTCEAYFSRRLGFRESTGCWSGGRKEEIGIGSALDDFDVLGRGLRLRDRAEGIPLGTTAQPGNWGGWAYFVVSATVITMVMVVLIVLVSRIAGKEPETK